MRRITHLLTTGVLLALYGGIAVLGYGLHDLVPEDGHHHHGLGHAEPGSGPPAVKVAIDDDHDCDICAFLDQARSTAPQIQAAIAWQHLVAALEVSSPRLVPPTAEFSYAPRGPPTLVG